MAIKDENIRPTPATGTTGYIHPTPPQTPTTPASTGRQPWSFHAGGLFAAPISPGVGSEYLTKMHQTLADIYKEADPKFEIALINIDNTVDTALAYSAIVVCVKLKNVADLGVAYHTLIIEATGERPSAIYQTVYNRQVEIIRVAGDAMDDELYKRVLEKVKQHFPVGPYRMADACVIPSGFNPEDKNLVKRLALSAGMAATVELEIHQPGFMDINLASASYDSSLICNVSFSRQEMDNAVGEPVRSDIIVRFTSQRNPSQDQRQAQSLNAGNREQTISSLSGFVDVIYAPLAPVTGYNFYQPQQYNVPTQRYVARLIVTDIASNFSYTPSSILLWLATATAVRDDNNWIQALRPSPNTQGIDMYDIGALNIDANLENDQRGFGTRIDTKSDGFQLPDLGALITRLFRPGLVISLDVPECGPQTWYLAVFKEAANGNPNAQEVIMKAADSLTNGLFSRHFNATSGAMFTDVNNRIHMGYYTDSNGLKRDIRAIDYLAVANLIGDKDPMQIRLWSDTFYRTEIPLISRLAERRKMISGYTHDNAVFTGFAQRITFSTEFTAALIRGCSEAGLSTRIQTPTLSAEFNQQRGVGNFVNDALLSPGMAAGQTFMGRDYGYQAPVAGYQPSYYRY